MMTFDKRLVTMEFQKIKQQMIEYTSDLIQQPEIHPISRNNEIFLNTKLTRKPGYILTKDKERNKEKGRPFPVINK